MDFIISIPTASLSRYVYFMSWLENPQSNYVIAAYTVAAALLAGLTFASWCRFRARRNELAQKEKETPLP